MTAHTATSSAAGKPKKDHLWSDWLSRVSLDDFKDKDMTASLLELAGCLDNFTPLSGSFAPVLGFLADIARSAQSVHEAAAQKALNKEVAAMASPVSRTQGATIGYGAAVPVGEALSERLTLYSLAPNGDVGMLDIDKDGVAKENKDSVSLEAVQEKLGGGPLEVSRVQIDPDVAGYFLQNEAGEGVYIDHSNLDLNQLKVDGHLNAFVKSPITPSILPTPTAPAAAPMAAQGLQADQNGIPLVQVEPKVFST